MLQDEESTVKKIYGVRTLINEPFPPSIRASKNLVGPPYSLRA